MIFLPCTTSLVAYAIIFRSLFANDGLVNYVLVNLGILDKPYNFLTQPFAAKMVIILALLWRWTGYNMVFFLSGLQFLGKPEFVHDGSTHFITPLFHFGMGYCIVTAVEKKRPLLFNLWGDASPHRP